MPLSEKGRALCEQRIVHAMKAAQKSWAVRRSDVHRATAGNYNAMAPISGEADVLLDSIRETGRIVFDQTVRTFEDEGVEMSDADADELKMAIGKCVGTRASSAVHEFQQKAAYLLPGAVSTGYMTRFARAEQSTASDLAAELRVYRLEKEVRRKGASALARGPLGVISMAQLQELLDMASSLERAIPPASGDQECSDWMRRAGDFARETIDGDDLRPEIRAAIGISHRGDFRRAALVLKGASTSYSGKTLDLQKAFATVKAILTPLAQPKAPLTPQEALDHEFDAAISFAGPQRGVAEELAALAVARGMTVFYDKDHAAELWGEDLTVKLDEIYREKARFCVPIVSHEYADRDWTRLELRSARARALREKSAYILPLRAEDGVTLEGVPETIGYVSLSQYTLPEIADMLLKKVETKRKR